MKCETCSRRGWCPDKAMMICSSYVKDGKKIKRLKAAGAEDRRDTIIAIKASIVFVGITTIWLYLPSWFPGLY